MPDVSLLLIATKPGNYDKEKDAIETGLRELGALDAIANALAKHNGDYVMEKDDDDFDDTVAVGSLNSNKGILYKSVIGVPREKSTSMPDLPHLMNQSHSGLGYFSRGIFTSTNYNDDDQDDGPPLLPSIGSPTSRRAWGNYFTSLSTSRIPSHTSTNTSTNSLLSIPISPIRKITKRLLLHFIYKHKETHQFTCSSRMEPPYTSAYEQKRLFRLYQQVHYRMKGSGSAWLANNTDGSAAKSGAKKEIKKMRKSHRILFHSGKRESIIGWVTGTFELFATFGPLVSKDVCLHVCNQLLLWVKAEEMSLFILNTPVW